MAAQIKPLFVVNTTTENAVLDLFKENDLISHYVFENNEVLISEQTDQLVLSLEEYLLNLEGIKEWIVLIRKNLPSPLHPVGLFKIEFEKESDKIKSTYTLNQSILSQIEFDLGVGITISPRGEVSIPFSDFVNWSLFLDYIYLKSNFFV